LSSTAPPGSPPVTDIGLPDDFSDPTGKVPAVRRRKWFTRRWVIEWLIIIAVAVGVAILLRAFVVQTYYIPSGSMEPTLQVGDRILVNKLSYHLHAVNRGDIIVFSTPPNEVGKCGGAPVADLVKRVIGLPGETISDTNGTIYINNKKLAQPWIKNDPYRYTASFPPVHIAANHYFVMGDHRTDSCDSRIWGTVPRSDIVGRVFLRIWPIWHFTIF